MKDDLRNRILVGHVLDRLRELPDESVHCVVTSPPYLGLRDYGIEPQVWGGLAGCAHEWKPRQRIHRGGASGGGAATNGRDQSARNAVKNRDAGAYCGRCDAWHGHLGLEPTVELYVAHVVEIFREVWRVLRDDGTLFLNLGDSYAGSGRGRNVDGSHNPKCGSKQASNRGSVSGSLPPHHGLHGRLVESGAIGTDWTPPPPGLKSKDLIGVPWRVAFALQANGWWLRSDIIYSKPNPMPESVLDRPTRSHEYVFLLAKAERYFYDADAIREPYREDTFVRQRYGWESTGNRIQAHQPGRPMREEPDYGHLNPLGRNRRTVWTIPTQSCPEAHFATFPEALVEPCILAGTSERGACWKCGAPWFREVKVEYNNPGNRTTNGPRSTERKYAEFGTSGFDVRLEKRVSTVGWRPTCSCTETACSRCGIVLEWLRDEKHSAPTTVRRLRNHIQAGSEQDAVPQQGLYDEVDRQTQKDLEGKDQGTQRLHTRLGTGASERSQDRLCDGTSDGHEPDDRAALDSKRDRASPQRKSCGQQTIESSTSTKNRTRQTAAREVSVEVSEVRLPVWNAGECQACREKLIERPCSTLPSIVLDPFFGSGTTGLVAVKAGRDFVGIELNPDYAKMAEERIAPELAQSRLF